ncbi:MAG: bifunctional methylenetetrahydrofolate dehydrogenase/methenyltetrahydrofolate cyclohydrolase [Pseudomonadales bacterium]|nr:bifunctional methylenetetrahydrofolate dehydrogenase/methenyltetrahydrofolate cyclohydrolase [Pseudomonadales bacterium]
MIDPAEIAEQYLKELKDSVSALNQELHVAGFIASEDKPSIAYANATKRVFDDAGFHYHLRQVQRLELEKEILAANENPDVHGIFVYFPVFANQEDDYLRNLVHYTKDIEAGSLYWTRKLTANDRLANGEDSNKKALIPCTPLAIVKILDDIGEYGSGERPINDKTVTIFNRSEVIGRPLAVMMSNDGARIYSFDENGPLMFRDGQPEETSVTRSEALAQSNIVITGVPDKSFCITANEVNEDTVCVNFSSEKNFEEAVAQKVRVFVPRVGPMTVAMCMRNTIRLFRNFHQ